MTETLCKIGYKYELGVWLNEKTLPNSQVLLKRKGKLFEGNKTLLVVVREGKRDLFTTVCNMEQ